MTSKGTTYRPCGTLNRRGVLTGGLSVALLPLPPASSVRAMSEGMAAVIREAIGAAELKPGRVKLDAPQIAENGNSVQLQISVDSAMTADDHVKTISVFSEKNPIPTVVRFHLGPRAGHAKVATNIRLAATQRIMAIASMSDGSHWSGEAQVIVTLAACLDGS